MANKEAAAKNDYRSERKERLKKEAKKQNKKKIDGTEVAIKVILAVVVIGIVIGIAAAINAFGIPQRTFTAVKVGDRNYSVAEYEYYYTNTFQTYAQTASNGSFSLFDYTKDIETQKTTDEEGNEITYAELFKQNVMKTLETSNYYLNEAKAAGVTLDDEHKAQVDDTITEIMNYADQYGYSATRYASRLYGKGMTIKLLRSILEEQNLVAQYLNDKNADLYTNITDEEIEAEYANDPSEYQAIDIRLFGFEIPAEEDAEITSEEAPEATEAAEETTVEETAAEAEETTEAAEETTAEAAEETTAEETTEAEEETTEAPKSEAVLELEAKANEMLGKITDDASFAKLAVEYAPEEAKETYANDSATLMKGLKKSVVSTNIDEELADWLFSADRAAGDKKIFTADKYVYVMMVNKPVYREEDPLVNARHILVSFDSVQTELADAEAAEPVEEETAETTAEAVEEAAETIAEAAETTAEAVEETEAAVEETEAAVEETEAAVEETEAAVEETEEQEASGTYSAKVVTEAYKQAKAILAEFEAGEKTEEAFGELAETYSDDTGSVGENATNGGGLYTDIAKGQMVTEFENWVYDAARQPGDTGIVKTSYGYHVMYFVSRNDEPSWKADIRTALGNAAAEEAEKEVEGNYLGTASAASFLGIDVAKIAYKGAHKLLNALYVNNNA